MEEEETASSKPPANRHGRFLLAGNVVKAIVSASDCINDNDGGGGSLCLLMPSETCRF